MKRQSAEVTPQLDLKWKADLMLSSQASPTLQHISSTALFEGRHSHVVGLQQNAVECAKNVRS